LKFFDQFLIFASVCNKLKYPLWKLKQFN